MELNVSDLTKILAVSAAAFGVLRAGLGRPIVRSLLNANRSAGLLVGLGFLFAAAGLLKDQTGSSNPAAWGTVLTHLVTEEKSSGHVMLAGFALLNGVTVLALVGYCRLTLPRDPATFNRWKDLPRLVPYYVRLSGGLDFAVVIRLAKTTGAEPQTLALGLNVRELQPRLEVLMPPRSAEKQVEWWTQTAVRLHHEFDRMNGVLDVGGQGHCRRILFDVQYGGFMFEYVRPPEVGTDVLFVFAATLLQHEVDNRQFETHFDLLVRAVRCAAGGAEKL
jgi:hypothetical protein